MKRLGALLLAVSVVLHGSAALAAAPAPPQPETWIANWDVAKCELIRLSADRTTALKIDFRPVSGHSLVLMGDRKWKKNPRITAQTLTVALSPSGERMSGDAIAQESGAGPLVGARLGKSDFLSKLSVARGIAIEASGTRLLEMNFPEPAKAVQQLRKCGDALLASWQIDPAAVARVKEQAKPIAEFAPINGYPAEALRQSVQGDVIVLTGIDDKGDVTSCRALDPKPDPILVEATCTPILRMKFKPALDYDGRPIASHAVVPIRWRLPKE